MTVGSWGDVVFEVRGSKVETYDEYVRTAEGRWGLHDVINSKPRPQFGGPGQDEINLLIRLSSDMGVDPRAEMEKLRRAVAAGTHAPFLRNGKPESQGDWYIESAEETDLVVGRNGAVQFAEMALILKEYF